MTKEEALRDFLSSLKTSLTNAAVYSKDHPIFLKSSEDLKAKTDSLLIFLNPIKIGISPDSLFLDGSSLEKPSLPKELASFFHFRKVESIEIRAGLSLKELIFFVSKASLPVKEISREGGLELILRKADARFILVKGLDYSGLLASQGRELGDIWGYLFQDAAEKGNTVDIFALADNFGKILGKLKVSDLLENEELYKNINNFLNYLKVEASDKFQACSREIAALILRDRPALKSDKQDKLRVFFKDLNGDGMSDVLLAAAASDSGLDALGVELLSSLLDKNQNESAALSLADKIKGGNLSEAKSRAVKKLQELFFAAKGPPQDSGPYRKNLEFLFKNTLLENSGPRALSQESTRLSYQFLILNLLIGEKSKAKLSLLKDTIKEELDSVIKNKDTEFLRHFLEICERRRKESSFSGIFDPLKNDVLASIENMIFQATPAGGELEGFLNLLNRSFLGEEYYLNKIFNENRIEPGILKMYFKLFADKQGVFYDNLKIKSPDAEFLRNLIEAVKEIDPASSLEILKNIFSFSHSLIKLEILKCMREMPVGDANFLFSVLKEENVFLRKEALGVLIDKTVQENAAGFDNGPAEALKLLLDVPDSWGKGNKALEENIDIVVELGLVEQARDLLLALSRRGSFWNKKLREKARVALEGFYAGAP